MLILVQSLTLKKSCRATPGARPRRHHPGYRTRQPGPGDPWQWGDPPIRCNASNFPSWEFVFFGGCGENSLTPRAEDAEAVYVGLYLHCRSIVLEDVVVVASLPSTDSSGYGTWWSSGLLLPAVTSVLQLCGGTCLVDGPSSPRTPCASKPATTHISFFSLPWTILSVDSRSLPWTFCPWNSLSLSLRRGLFCPWNSLSFYYSEQHRRDSPSL